MRNAKLLILMVVVGLCLIGQTFVSAAPLLKNPGFEDNLNYWEDLYGPPTQLSDTVFRNGLYSAYKYVDAVTDQDYWSQVYQEVAYLPGQPLYARMYVKTTFSPEATARGGIIVQFIDVNGDILDATLNSRAVGGNTNWRLVEISAQAAPTGTTKARLSGYLYAKQGDTISLTGNAYYDDAYIVKQYRALQLQKNLYNVGFENGLNDWLEQDGYPAFLEKVIIQSGKYSAGKEIVTVAERDYWSRIYQEVACTSGKAVASRIYMKPTFAPTALAKAGFQLEFYDANNQLLARYKQQLGGTTTGWRQLIINVASTPENCAKVRVSAYVYAPRGNNISVGGKAYFDNCRLTITTP
jgi:hypothetical protein